MSHPDEAAEPVVNMDHPYALLVHVEEDGMRTTRTFTFSTVKEALRFFENAVPGPDHELSVHLPTEVAGQPHTIRLRKRGVSAGR